FPPRGDCWPDRLARECRPDVADAAPAARSPEPGILWDGYFQSLRSRPPSVRPPQKKRGDGDPSPLNLFRTFRTLASLDGPPVSWCGTGYSAASSAGFTST